MALPTIALDDEFTVYAGVDAADKYASGSAHADAWRELTDDDAKGRYLVTATRVADRQIWRGDKAEADQPLAFPRINMGITPEPLLDDNDIPVDIVSGVIELAIAQANGEDIQSSAIVEDRVRAMSAGSVSITFARSDSIPTRFPQIVQELFRRFLGGSGSSFKGRASGVDAETLFPIELEYGPGGL